MKDLVIVGAGGFGRETVDTVRTINKKQLTWRIVGIVDDNPSADNLIRLKSLDLQHLGGMNSLPAGAAVAICIGHPATRAKLIRTLAPKGHAFPTLIHPSTTIGSAFVHGEGLITLAGVSIGTSVTVGNHVHINAHAVLGHDVRLADFVSVNPNATVSGAVTVGDHTLIGAGSVILEGLTLGNSSLVGAAACVTTDVPPEASVKGVPARSFGVQ